MGTLHELLLKLHPDPTRRGREFERICAWYLLNEPLYQRELKRVWLWDEWGGRWGADAGIDMVAETHEGKLWAVQVKAYAEDRHITKAGIDSFLSESSRPQFAHRLIVATTNLLGHTALRTIDEQEKPVGRVLLADLEKSPIPWPASPDELRPAQPERKQPRPQSKEAIAAVCKGFDECDRGQLIMACGTGKTLVGLWVAEALKSKRTLVLVPSLSLLDQTMREWTANGSGDFRVLPVCSDESVSGKDELESKTSELGVPVTTDPEQISEFLKQPGQRVVFATYQSSPRLAEAFELGAPGFDLAIADEAHRCAGPAAGPFATVLSDAIVATRRLFMTATPRYFTDQVRRKGDELDYEIASMDDEVRFGPVFHHLSFGAAIDRGLLSDYQVAIIGVDDATYRRYAEFGCFVTTDGQSVTDARTLAAQIGLAKAMRDWNLRRVLSFHSRVKAARRFSEDVPEVIAWMPEKERPGGRIWSEHVSGEMPAGERRVLLERFRHLEEAERGLLSNARCLAEGVDVPSIDGVAFVDPRRSTVDIIQAVGRAIRLSDEKKVGTVVLPVFIDKLENIEDALDSSAFQPVWQVLKALRAHDDKLAEELDQVRLELGRLSERGASLRLPDKIKVDLPVRVGEEFVRAFEMRLVEAVTTSWEFHFGLLLRYLEREGHASPPVTHVELKHRLGSWVDSQRQAFARGQLLPERRHRLQALPGWVWDPFETQWEDAFALLLKFVERNGHARVPREDLEDGFGLGGWVLTQRQNYRHRRTARLTPDKIARLETLPEWVWSPHSARWEVGFSYLQRYVERNGHAVVPASHVEEGFELGTWVGKQRAAFSEDRINQERIQRLEGLPLWSWDQRQSQWDEAFAYLEQFVGREGHADVPSGHRENGFNLGVWVAAQRQGKRTGRLSGERQKKLEVLRGWRWEDQAESWEAGFRRLVQFVNREAHALVPQAHVEDGYPLGSWVSSQRSFYRRRKLAAERAMRLEALPQWQWDPLDASWHRSFNALAEYVGRHGTSLVPQAYVTSDGLALGRWVNKQRQKFKHDKLTGEQIDLLQSLPEWTWSPTADLWTIGLRHLEDYVARHHTARVPASYVADDGFKLGTWVVNRRTDRSEGRLSVEQTDALGRLPGWSWDQDVDRWYEKLANLTRYVEEHGNARVPRNYVAVDGSKLGAWLNKQRAMYRDGTLDPEKAVALDSVPGWSGQPHADLWDEGFGHLEAYVSENGHANVPDSYVNESGFQLGTWVGRQRRLSRRNELSGERRERLESLKGWDWDPRSANWESAFRLLVSHIEEHGHSMVPASYCTAGGFRLGNWVSNQRQFYRKGQLSPDRIERLGALKGWMWRAR